MKKAYSVVITGDEMKELSQQEFWLEVYHNCDHGYRLEQFMIENGIDYPHWDYCFAHEAVKLAILGNVVLLLGNFHHIIALPDVISFYQFEQLQKSKALFLNEKSSISIMNITKGEDRIVYEGIDSGNSFEIYNNLVCDKLQKGISKKKRL